MFPNSGCTKTGLPELDPVSLNCRVGNYRIHVREKRSKSALGNGARLTRLIRASFPRRLSIFRSLLHEAGYMTIKRTSLALMTGFLAGCVPNQAFRTQGEVDCVSDFVGCKNALIEKYEKYDLAFIEFTDRGNLFSRTRYAHVLERIKKAADADPGAAVIVFVHGWKNNASFDDANVKSFRQMLKILSDNGLTFGRRPIGIYVGWRGLSVDMAGVKELTYWERKAVAQEVGKGGVTEVLLRLRQVTAANRNLYVVVGHSFGSYARKLCMT